MVFRNYHIHQSNLGHFLCSLSLKMTWHGLNSAINNSSLARQLQTSVARVQNMFDILPLSAVPYE